MNKNCIFTICSKNYLAQALTLRESTTFKNKDVDFFIFLADMPSKETQNLNLVLLDDSWVQKWKEMAFKYNVIEFNTSIKPFCFKKLFVEGYEKVMYLDPDIYVTDKLDNIWSDLDSYSIVLTPHVYNLSKNYTGAVLQEELLFVGIYNLGFCAIRNNTSGIEIVEWWCKRLQDKCYADKWDSLHVDQRWMDFIPGFFPKETLISHNFGINVAVWNLHERELLIENNKYIIKDLKTEKKYPLLFFHFSGFDPFNDKVINRRQPQFGIEHFPSFEPIIKEYKEMEYKNGYDIYSKLSYNFNSFSNGYTILPLHRRLYRVFLENTSEIDPFDQFGSFYKILLKNSLIVKETTISYNNNKSKVKNGFIGTSKIDRIFKKMAKFLSHILGIKRYYFLLRYIQNNCRFENQFFLLNKK